MAKNQFNIAVIAGDGIGVEVMPEGLRALSAAAAPAPASKKPPLASGQLFSVKVQERLH